MTDPLKSLCMTTERRIQLMSGGGTGGEDGGGVRMTLYTHTAESMSGSSVHHGKYRLLVPTIPDGELGVLRLKRRHGYHLVKTHDLREC